jgi:hypothetical protein
MVKSRVSVVKEFEVRLNQEQDGGKKIFWACSSSQLYPLKIAELDTFSAFR